MSNKAKQMVVFIPCKDKSTRRKGEDSVANGKELFEAVKKCFESKKEVKFGKHTIHSIVLTFATNLESLNIQKDSIVVVHAFGGEINAKLRDGNQGDITASDTLKMLSLLMANTKVAEVHFAVCYSGLKGHIGSQCKAQYPELDVYGSNEEFDEGSVLYAESETLFQIVTKTKIKIKS